MSPSPGRPAGGRAVPVLDAWALTRRISPRPVVRVAAVDMDGRPVNAYPHLHPITGPPPQTPWAVHLADGRGRFHLLCADLDAKPGAATAAADAARLSRLLSQLGIPHLVCASGPTEGRHVWIGLRESVDPEVVRALAYLLKGWLPTLDVAPLVNAGSGCARPPGAPHRLGGHSRLLAGKLSVLSKPTVTRDQIATLVARLAPQVDAPPPAHGARPTLTGADGLPHLPGPRRPLSPSCQRLLTTNPTGDLSAVLWRVLCGAAAARWHYSDVAAVADAPGLEHARTLRAGATRTPRPTTGSASPTAVLRRQWARAVHATAEMAPTRTVGADDPGFDARAERVTAVVRAVQHRADASPGRWGRTRAGLAQRRVLDALCLFHLQAVRVDEVEADIRRLALTCGLNRETVRRSLLTLADDHWIARARPASGRHGAHWSVDPGAVIHRRVSETLSQADPRPPGTGTALRTVLTRELTARLDTAAHDAFAMIGGLGLAAGTLYSRLSEPLSTMDVCRLLGWSLKTTRRVLERLTRWELVERGEHCWRRSPTEHLDRAAADLGTSGVAQRRADLYRLERTLWAWWLAELAWMRAPRPRETRPRFWPSRDRAGWPGHPRHLDHRAHFAAARRVFLHRTRAAGYVFHSLGRTRDISDRTF